MDIINIILYFEYKKTEAMLEKHFLEKGIKKTGIRTNQTKKL
jgi:hypothetical protein